MTKIERIKLSISSTIEEALKTIDSGGVKIGLVVDDTNRLLGTVSDGDVRRGLLKGVKLQDSLELILHKTPIVCNVNDSKEDILKIAVENKIYQIPIVDENNFLVGLEEVNRLLKPSSYPNKVILMVGGLGTRLLPLTESTPKPMLHVGNKPILQTIVEKFASYGFTDITMCVNYKSHVIQDYFGDGSGFGVNIDYLTEEKRLGTAGALSLLTAEPEAPFFVMNGDLLTNVNFEHLLEFHQANKMAATMCVREYDFQVPYGVVNIDEGKITSIEEKPVQNFFVSAGIYMLEPSCLNLIPSDAFFDMPTLFTKLIELGESTASFPLREYWLDIGRIEEYEKANNEFRNIF
jgi:dTDP-glucose pyrophosphorylase